MEASVFVVIFAIGAWIVWSTVNQRQRVNKNAVCRPDLSAIEPDMSILLRIDFERLEFVVRMSTDDRLTTKQWDYRLIPKETELFMACRNIVITQPGSETWLIRDGNVIPSSGPEMLPRQHKELLDEAKTEVQERPLPPTYRGFIWSRYQEYLTYRTKHPEQFLPA